MVLCFHLNAELLSSPHFSAPPFLFPVELSIPRSFPAGFGVQGSGAQPTLSWGPSPPTPRYPVSLLPCCLPPFCPFWSLQFVIPRSSAKLQDPSWLCTSSRDNSFAFPRAERGGPAPTLAPAFLHLYGSISITSINRSAGLLGDHTSLTGDSNGRQWLFRDSSTSQQSCFSKVPNHGRKPSLEFEGFLNFLPSLFFFFRCVGLSGTRTKEEIRT